MAEPEIQNSQQNAQESQQRAQDSQRRARIRELEDEVERFRHASEDALQQLDWCIGYMHGSGKKGIARSLAKTVHTSAHICARQARRVRPSRATSGMGQVWKLSSTFRAISRAFAGAAW